MLDTGIQHQGASNQHRAFKWWAVRESNPRPTD
jgi:hypothetical protein